MASSPISRRVSPRRCGAADGIALSRTIRTTTLAALVLAASVLAACGGRPDAAFARQCRLTLPALNPEGAVIRVLRETRPRAGEVRIDYLVVDGATSRQRWVSCRFAEVPRGSLEIERLATESGTISGASLFLLKRFWLETPEAAAADPAG